MDTVCFAVGLSRIEIEYLMDLMSLDDGQGNISDAEFEVLYKRFADAILGTAGAQHV